MDIEWSFAASNSGTGVFWCEPCAAGIGTFKQTVDMGESERSVEDVLVLIRKIAPQWKAREYSTISRNCQHFSNTFLQFLIPSARLPSWLTAASDSLQIFAAIPDFAPAEKRKLSHSDALHLEYMLSEAELRMRDFQQRGQPVVVRNKSSEFARIIHGPEPVEPPVMIDTLKKLDVVRGKVDRRYSSYALAFIK
jgi:hypothetical protein